MTDAQPMINPMSLAGKRILVTGASSGIGRETAVLASRLGAQVIVTARNVERLAQTQALLAGEGHVLAPFDLMQVDDIPGWMRRLAADHGPLQGVVHSAGVQQTLPARNLQSDQYAAVMTVNVYAALSLARGFRQRGVAGEGGSLVYVASTLGHVGAVATSLYSASKGAIIALTRSLALEFARDRLRVNCVSPGTVLTEMNQELRRTLTEEQWNHIEWQHPLGVGQPRDIAHAIAFLLSDAGAWITGTALVVDGGYTAQ
ncbi:MAG: SDR family NAD(P)-dependent oxidoreductase [Armatimonadota bacterium]